MTTQTLNPQPPDAAEPEEAATDGIPGHLTDLGNAQRLAEWFGKDRLRYCAGWNRWLCWDGKRWAIDRTGVPMQWAKRTAKRLYDRAWKLPPGDTREKVLRFALQSEGRFRLQAMLALAESEPSIAITPEKLDADPWLLNVENGTLDLRTGVLHPHSRADYITKLAPVVYEPKATSPTFDKFLARIMPDPEDRAYLQRVVGYALTGSVREQELYILYGQGANGKSTLLNIIRAMLGDYGMNTPPSTLLARTDEGPRNDVARLKGARLVAAVETDDGKRLAEAVVKAMTGGDRMVARFLYGEHFEYDPEFKLFLAVNHKPVVQGTDHGIWRRIRLIPLTQTISDEEKDKDLVEKLRAELPGILNWAHAGCQAWQHNGGLHPPKSVQMATAAYRSEQDVFAQFIEERCILDPAVKVPTAALYNAYATWCLNAGVHHPLTKKRFGERLKELGLKPGKADGGETRVWQGIRLSVKDVKDTKDASSENPPMEEADEYFPEVVSVASVVSV